MHTVPFPLTHTPSSSQTDLLTALPKMFQCPALGGFPPTRTIIIALTHRCPVPNTMPTPCQLACSIQRHCLWKGFPGPSGRSGGASPSAPITPDTALTTGCENQLFACHSHLLPYRSLREKTKFVFSWLVWSTVSSTGDRLVDALGGNAQTLTVALV